MKSIQESGIINCRPMKFNSQLFLLTVPTSIFVWYTKQKATFWDGSSNKDAVYVETKSPIAVERRFMRRYNRKSYFKEHGLSIVWQAYKQKRQW